MGLAGAQLEHSLVPPGGVSRRPLPAGMPDAQEPGG